MIKLPTLTIAFSLLLGLLCCMLPACNWFASSEKERLSDSYEKLYVLDVNDKELYENARIAGSINVQYDDVEKLAKKLDKSYDIVLYCTDYACTESDRVAKVMRNLGFEKVFVYPGGIHEWYLLSLNDGKNYPIEGPADLKFLSRPIKKFEREEANTLSSGELSKLLLSRKIS